MRTARRRKEARSRRRRLVKRVFPYFPVGTTRQEEVALLYYIDSGGERPLPLVGA